MGQSIHHFIIIRWGLSTEILKLVRITGKFIKEAGSGSPHQRFWFRRSGEGSWLLYFPHTPQMLINFVQFHTLGPTLRNSGLFKVQGARGSGGKGGNSEHKRPESHPPAPPENWGPTVWISNILRRWGKMGTLRPRPSQKGRPLPTYQKHWRHERQRKIKEPFQVKGNLQRHNNWIQHVIWDFFLFRL